MQQYAHDTAGRVESAQPMYAGFFPRFLSYVVDSIFLTLVGIVVGLSIGILSGLTRAEMLVLVTTVSGLLSPLYLVAFWAMVGATPGKILLSMRVVGPDCGTDGIGWVRAILRLIGYVVSSFFLYLGFLWIAVDKEHRGWHDTIAGTRVIHL